MIGAQSRCRDLTLRQRRGSSLIELLVSLPLAILAAAAAAVILVRIARTARAQSAMLANASALRHAGLVVSADLAPLLGRDVAVVTDTLLEFQSHLGVFEVCATPGQRTVIAAVAPGASASWVDGVRPGDVVTTWELGEADAAAPPERRHDVVGSPNALPPASCGMGRNPVPRWHLSLADSVRPLAVGTPLLVQRAVRYVHYRSGTSWWLGRQSRDGGIWDGLQPVVGPLLPPANGGVTFRPQAADGIYLPTARSMTDSAASLVAALEVTVRMPRRVSEYNSGRPDSASILVPLRGAAAQRGHP